MATIRHIDAHDYDQIKIETTLMFTHAVKELLKTKDKVSVAIPGGRSIKPLFEGFKETKDLSKEEWEKVHFFLADERLVSQNDKESNTRLIRKSFFDDLKKRNLIDELNIHLPDTLSQEIQKEIIHYSKDLKLVSNNIDIMILGVGEDGHVASLFPDHPELKVVKDGFILVRQSPKPPANRISISPNEIKNASYIFLFFIGKSKRVAYDNFMDDMIPIGMCPAKIAFENKDAKIYVIRGHI